MDGLVTTALIIAAVLYVGNLVWLLVWAKCEAAKHKRKQMANIVLSSSVPSYHHGFSPRDGDPKYENMWDGLVGAWSPNLGISGFTLPNWASFGPHNIAKVNRLYDAGWRVMYWTARGSVSGIDYFDFTFKMTKPRLEITHGQD